MTEETITTLSFNELPEDDESAWERFDAMTDEESDAMDDDPPLTEAQRNQFRRAYYVKGVKVWQDDKTIGERLAENGAMPEVLLVNPDIAKWFKAQGSDYLARMNTVLREYVESHRA